MSWPGYPAYKDSATAWLGQLPDNWDLRRLGSLFAERKTTVSDRDFQPLSVTKDGIVPQLDTAAKTDNGDNRKLVRAGDFVINSRSDRKGSAGISSLDGSVSVISTVLEPRGLLGRYAHYLLRCEAFQEEYYRFGTGIVADLWSTRYSAMKMISLPMPTSQEQDQIARFLDRETAKIDALIAKQEQLIATLREDRTATITHAVTKGLDPDVEMKDSGVEWLGQVPHHWVTRRLASTYRELDERLGNREIPELLSVSIHVGVRPRRELVTDKEARADDFTKYKLCSAGDIVLNRMRAFQGGLGVARENGIVSPDYMVMRVHSAECPDYLGYLMKTPWFVEQMTSRLRGIGGVDQGSARTPRINPSDLGRIAVALPPALEQEDIANALGDQLADLDRLITKTAQLIQTMREYRSALITDAVTGKIDVRGAA